MKTASLIVLTVLIAAPVAVLLKAQTQNSQQGGRPAGNVEDDLGDAHDRKRLRVDFVQETRCVAGVEGLTEGAELAGLPIPAALAVTSLARNALRILGAQRSFLQRAESASVPAQRHQVAP